MPQHSTTLIFNILCLILEHITNSVSFGKILAGSEQENLASTSFYSGTISVTLFFNKNCKKVEMKKIGLGAFLLVGYRRLPTHFFT